MGLFSSKKKTYVDTAVMRVVEDNQVPDTLLEATVESIFTGTPLAQTIIDSTHSNPFRNFERMYHYAATGDYHYGLPDARVLSSDQAADKVKQAIEAEVGRSVTLDYAYFRPINNVHVGWKTLIDDYGYDPQTNEVTALSAEYGHTVYLDKMVAVHSLESLSQADSSAVGAWERSPNSGYTPERQALETGSLTGLVKEQDVRIGADEEESVELHFVWEVAGELNEETGIRAAGEIKKAMQVISLQDYDLDKEYHQAKYIDGGQVRYWTYDVDTGQHPALDSVFQLNFTAPGTYFPFTVFRRERQNRTAPELKDTHEYKSSQKLLGYLNMDFQQIGDAIHENPDISDVDQAVMVMAVPMNSQVPVEIDYLMQYFAELDTSETFSATERIKRITSLSAGESADYAIEIADADFRMVLSYSRIIRKVVPGNIGAVGEFTNELLTENGIGLQPNTTNKVRVLRKQITPGAYEEVRIYNPKTRYDIFAGKGVTGSDDDDRLMVPLDYSITKHFQTYDKEKLYYRSLHFIFNSRVTQKVKWYQSGFFKKLLIVAAVVITAISLGSAWQTIVVAAELGASALKIALIKVISATVISAFVVPVIAQEIVKVVGPELAMVIAAAALVYGGYQGIKAGELVEGGLADNLIKAASGIAKGVQLEIKDLFARFADEVDTFENMRDEVLEELDAAKALLDDNLFLDPMIFTSTGPLTLIGESPTQHYDRTIHSGNVGLRAYDLVENFVEATLTLPTFNDSVGHRLYI